MNRDFLPQGLRRVLFGSAVGHAVVLAFILVAGSLNGRAAAPPINAMPTKLVRLGKKRDKKLLPRVEAIAPAPKKSVSLEAPSKPVAAPAKPPVSGPSARDRVKEMNRVSTALDRLKHDLSEPEGDPEGVKEGTVSDLSLAIAGNKYLGEILACLQANWNIHLPPRRVKNRSAGVVLRVAPDGKFIDHRIVKSSGLPAFDQATKRAVKACGKVSPPPPELKEMVGREGVGVTFKPF